ncbi:MAG: molybdate ABC transporter substrate-binding protein, partial [Burkholderiales bacterium]|nr:molybdate ABC transporter substrate-binding protein [Burkholderiales bacterium]
AYARAGGGPVQGEYGPSGLLRDRLAKGERADVFASANMEHPQSLAAAGGAGAVRPVARNQLCALVAPGLAVTSDTLLERMLDPAVKLGTSTPKADPSGDYAFALFGKAEAHRPGAKAALEAKALKLTGGPDSPPPPKDRSVYGMLVAERKADIFLTYCTNAKAARDEHPTLSIVAVPAPLAVGATYGMTVLAGAGPAAATFADFVLAQEAQRILSRHGFDAP